MSVAPNRMWLKMIGAADWPLDDLWIEQVPALLREVRTPRTPSSIGQGDLLIYYAAGSQKIFAIARSTMNGRDALVEHLPSQARWPYLLRVQVLLAIPNLALAPHWRVLEMDSRSVQQKSYVEISTETYRKGWQAIVERTRR